MIRNLVAAAAISLAAVTMSVGSVQAATFLSCGDATTIGGPGDDTEFGFGVTAGGGAGSCSINFTALSDPIPGSALATIGPINLGGFSGLTISWISAVSGVLNTSPINLGFTTLATLFQSPDDLIQDLTIAWTGSTKGANFDVEVTVEPVPVPAALPLLASGLLGMGYLARRRKAARAA